MASGNFKDLIRKTSSNKTLRDKAFNIDKNPKYNGYQRGLASMGRNCFDKNFLALILQEALLKLILNQLAEE